MNKFSGNTLSSAAANYFCIRLIECYDRVVFVWSGNITALGRFYVVFGNESNKKLRKMRKMKNNLKSFGCIRIKIITFGSLYLFII